MLSVQTKQLYKHQILRAPDSSKYVASKVFESLRTFIHPTYA